MTQFAPAIESDERNPLIRPRTPTILPIFNDLKKFPTNGEYGSIGGLLAILSWKRPFESATEEHFARHYLDSIKGMTQDKFGNRHMRIPNADSSPSRILWSSHIDTCHHDEGYQRLIVKRDKDKIMYVSIQNAQEGNCLGADDGTGVWLMIEMIRAGKPGYYIFHRGEEKGCQGSRWIVEQTPHVLKDIDAAIALDRRDFDNIITHQGGERGCSEAFAKFIGIHLEGFKPDPTGAFTDTKQYFKLIPECTNLSIGYQSNHGPLERQYLAFARELRDGLIAMPIQNAPIVRDPHKPEYRGATTYYSSHSTEDFCQYRMRWVPKGTKIECDWDKETSSWIPKDMDDAKRILENERLALKAAADALLQDKKDDPPPAKLITTENFTPATNVEIMYEVWADCDLDLEELITKYPRKAAQVMSDYKLNSEDILCAVYGDQWLNFIYRNCKRKGV